MLNESNIQIAGIQKLTCLDFPGKLAAIIFLPGCNMNCPFCHNINITKSNKGNINTSNLIKFLESRQNILEGIVITGGEPSLQDIVPLLEQIKNLNYAIKIDTNGLQPDEITRWINSGLVNYIAMDIKNSINKYSQTCGTVNVNINSILESIHIIMSSGISYEFRTTVTPTLHTPDDIKNICHELIPNAMNYAIQPFVTQPNIANKTLTEPTDAFLQACLTNAKNHVKHAFIRGRDIA